MNKLCNFGKDMKEIWKDIIDFDKYQVSNLGRVKSLWFGKEKILKPKLTKSQYRFVILCNGNERKTFKIAVLVAMAFHDHKPCGFKRVVNHKDFNKLNDRADNLEVISQRENANMKHIKSISGYTGVTLDRRKDRIKKWKAQIQIKGKNHFLGLFISPYFAHLAYEQKLRNIDYGNVNTIETTDSRFCNT